MLMMMNQLVLRASSSSLAAASGAKRLVMCLSLHCVSDMLANLLFVVTELLPTN
jgi:hypothetical protein